MTLGRHSVVPAGRVLRTALPSGPWFTLANGGVCAQPAQQSVSASIVAAAPGSQNLGGELGERLGEVVVLLAGRGRESAFNIPNQERDESGDQANEGE